MSEERAKDNTVKVDLNMDQVQAGAPLSTSNLSITYPGIDRNFGNLVNFDTALALLLQAAEWHMTQTVMHAPEDLPIMNWWLNNIASKFTALADKYASPEASKLAGVVVPPSTITKPAPAK